MKKVFLGVGHGGSDPGTVANGFREKDLNLAIALACNEELVRHGVITLMSRTVDENDSLTQEIRECNAFAPDLAVDIHNNAGGGDGAEAFHHYGGGSGKILAENILREIVAIGQNSRGAKTRKNAAGRDWYGFIRETLCPAVIVECAFVDNPTDLQIVDTAEETARMGIAIAKGILATLGLPWIPPVTEETEPTPETPPVTADPEPTPEVPPVTAEPETPPASEEPEPTPETPPASEEPEIGEIETDSFWKRLRLFLKELIRRLFRWLDE